MTAYHRNALGLTLTLILGSAAAGHFPGHSLLDQNLNNAFSGSQGITGLNPFQLGRPDFLLGVANGGNPAFLSSPGFQAGAAALVSQFASQAQQSGFSLQPMLPLFQPPSVPFIPTIQPDPRLQLLFISNLAPQLFAPITFNPVPAASSSNLSGLLGAFPGIPSLPFLP